jgi:type III pantothenate kinase
VRLLAIDAGNSRIKWGVHDGAAWTQRGVVATSAAQSLAGDLSGVSAPEGIIGANVAGGAVQRQIEESLRGFPVKAEWIVSREEQCGVRSSYADPAQLGPDRWAALVAARRLHGGPCAVVNAGTTTTIDALSAEGIFLGGFIVPGLTLMRHALSQKTAGLKLQDGGVSFFPNNTGDAIASGAANAIAGAIERMVRYLADTAGIEPLLLLSGGDAPTIGPLLSGGVELVDNLVLDGLAVIGASGVGT